jgi:hypothetical protein
VGIRGSAGDRRMQEGGRVKSRVNVRGDVDARVGWDPPTHITPDAWLPRPLGDYAGFVLLVLLIFGVSVI